MAEQEGEGRAVNTRPCAACKHLDSRVLTSNAAFCWATFAWRAADGTVPDCHKAERANGQPPPGQITFGGERR